METEPEGERLYRVRLCMGRFSGDPDFAEMPEIYDLFGTNRDENGELTTIGYWAELNLDFLPGDVLDTSLGCYQCAPGSVDYELLQRIAENQTPITKSQVDIDSALDAAREIIVGFGDTTVDALWYDEASSSAAIRQRLHVSAWEPYGNTPDNLIAVGFDMTRYGTAHQSRTLILERSGPGEPWEYSDMDKAPTYARPAEPTVRIACSVVISADAPADSPQRAVYDFLTGEDGQNFLTRGTYIFNLDGEYPDL